MIVEKLVEKAMMKAQGVQASLVRSESTNISFENDRLKSSKTSQSTQVDVKVILDGKVGTSYTTDVSDMDGVVGRALEVAEFGSPAHFTFPGYKEGCNVKIYDDAVPPVTKDEMICIGEEMMTLVKAYNPDILVSAHAGKGVYSIEFANSSGVSYTTENTIFGTYVYGRLIRCTEKYSSHR